MSGSNQSLSRPGALPVWPSASPLDPAGLVTYMHPIGAGHELYQLPVSRLQGAKALAPTSGVAQVETATVTAKPTSAGNLDITVTSALFVTPVTVTITTDDGTVDLSATLVADKITAALEADATFAAHFTVDNTAGAVIVTAIKSAANDATLNIAWAADRGFDAVAASVNTTAGVLGTIPDYLGQLAVDGSTVKAATNLNLNTWTSLV